MVFGSWTATGGAGESIDYLPNKLSVQRTFTVPADGAWFWGDARYRNFLEMDCDHHYRGDLNPAISTYNPLFTAGELPPPYDVCTFNNCYSCRLDWGGVKPSDLYTTSAAPAFLAAGSYTVTVSTLNGGGDLTSNLDELNLWIAQENRSDLSSVTIYQPVADDDPTQAGSADVAARYFIANSADRVAVVPTFHGSADFPGGPGVTYTAKWDTGDEVAGEEQRPRVAYGLTVVDLPIPKMLTGSHTFTLTAKFSSGKTLTSPSMSVFVYAQAIYLNYGSFDPKNPVDDAPKFIPGVDVNGNAIDLRNGPQTINLNILVGRGSSGTFNVHLDTTSYPGIAMNYPINNPDTDPDADFGSKQIDQNNVAIPKGGAPKFVTFPLQIHDYGASFSVEATIPYKKGTYTSKRRFPLDDDNNGLPDAGWNTPSGHVNTAGIASAADDMDSTPGGPAQNGDGLSAFEEYRGFVIQGQHERLDPQTRDLFIDADPNIARSFIDTHLPYRRHDIKPGESAGTDLMRFGVSIDRTAPVIDPNRTNVPGARQNGQRALRLVYRTSGYPTRRDPSDGNLYDVWQFGILGITWQDQMGIEPLDNSQAQLYATLAGPDQVRFVEIIDRAESNNVIHMDPAQLANNGQPVYNDAATGQPVPDCANVTAGTPCDRYAYALGLVAPELFPPNTTTPTRFILHSRLTYPGDFYTKVAHPTCGATNQVEVSQTDFSFLRSAVVAHEVGHNLGLDHSANCGELMFGIGGLMPDNLPYPTNYTNTEVGAMRTH